MGYLPKKIRDAYTDLYHNDLYYGLCDWWYQRFIQYLINAGIPDEGVIGILKKHHISTVWVKQYCRIHSPEHVAQNVLKYRHRPKIYDNLAKPKIRITKKRIADFRKKLEDELRRIWISPCGLEETIREECYDSADEDIAKMISHGTTAERWARTLNEL